LEVRLRSISRAEVSHATFVDHTDFVKVLVELLAGLVDGTVERRMVSVAMRRAWTNSRAVDASRPQVDQ
jgi:hypothetical protein